MPVEDNDIAAGIDAAALDAFVACAGAVRWQRRLAELAGRAAAGRTGRAAQQLYAVELTIERLRGRPNRPPSPAERRIAALAAVLAREMDSLAPPGRKRLRARLAAALTGEQTLVPLFHLAACLMRERARGFAVAPLGLAEDAPFDLMLAHGDGEAELVCDVISAEAGRCVHRGAWFDLADRIDPDLQTWLAAHPGRYLLKMTLPQGLEARDAEALGLLHGRIRDMLASQSRSAQSEAAVLRLDPLVFAAAQADALGLVPSLRRHFGPEAHLAVSVAGEAMFVMAARAGQEDAVAAAIRRRMTAVAPARLTGARPGLLAMLVEDVDRREWQVLRENFEIEREARNFLTCPEAASVAAITCESRFELFGLAAPGTPPTPALRVRNPGCAIRVPAGLAEVVTSIV